MRRTLVVTIVGVVVGALVLAGAGTFLLANGGARRDAARQLAVDARRVATEAPTLLTVPSAKLRRNLVRVVKATVGADFVAVVPGAAADGSAGTTVVLGSLPGGVTVARLRLADLLRGATVSGTAGAVVYAAVVLPGVEPGAVARTLAPGALPAGTTGAARLRAATAAGAVVVMVLTRRFAGAGLGGLYLLLVSAGTVAVAAAVAVVLSRRITRPLVDAVAATERIARGDLSVRTPVGDTHHPELAALGDAINTMAESLARARGQERQFLLSVSHDLRTPLTSILGYAEAIADGAADDPGAAAAVIAAEARRLARLVQDLLDLARLDARQFSLHLQPVAVTPLVRAAADAIRPAVDRAGLDLRVALPLDEPLLATADPDRTRQVVANLLENAYKFAASAVDVVAAPEPGGWVVVTVADDGPGIAADDLPKVFDRFFQSARAEARQAGSGLGLAIVAELVGAMGGSVRVLSGGEPRGSRFDVRLPATGTGGNRGATGPAAMAGPAARPAGGPGPAAPPPIPTPSPAARSDQPAAPPPAPRPPGPSPAPRSDQPAGT